MPDVFISHAHQDEVSARAICSHLEGLGILCWIAPRDVRPGAEWAEAIVDAIDGCRVLILVLSVHSNDSPQVVREVARAAGRRVPIVPVCLGDVALSKSMDFFVSPHHWLQTSTNDVRACLPLLGETVADLLRPQTAATRFDDARDWSPTRIPIGPSSPPPRLVSNWPMLLIATVLAVCGVVSQGIILGAGPPQPVRNFAIQAAVGLVLFFVPSVYLFRQSLRARAPEETSSVHLGLGWWVVPVALGALGGVYALMRFRDLGRGRAVNMFTIGYVVTWAWLLPATYALHQMSGSVSD